LPEQGLKCAAAASGLRLQGQVNVCLRGTISAVRSPEDGLLPDPDVAVRKFVLTMRGGNRGLLDHSGNLCRRKRFAFLNLKAQNSRRLKTNRLRLNIPGCRRITRC
jgi:hypothetical protein